MHTFGINSARQTLTCLFTRCLTALACCMAAWATAAAAFVESAENIISSINLHAWTDRMVLKHTIHQLLNKHTYYFIKLSAKNLLNIN